MQEEFLAAEHGEFKIDFFVNKVWVGPVNMQHVLWATDIIDFIANKHARDQINLWIY